MSFLQTLRPQDVTPGYRALAALSQEGYFDLILTTNLDPLLDDALAAARLWRKDYLLLVNGVLRGDRVLPLLRAAMPRVKVLKLHGDLFNRFMAWTEKEMEQFIDDLDPGLTDALDGRDLLVVGHSLRDERIAQIARNALAGTGVVWYAHPVQRSDVLPVHDRLREVIDPECAFERMFTGLASRLEVKADQDVPGRLRRGDVAPAPLTHSDPRAQTLDDVLAAVVGVGTHGGSARATGVLIAEPRGILCDRFPLDQVRLGQRVPVRTRDGEQWSLPVLRIVTERPFGPVLLEAPQQWTAHPVTVDPRPLSLGDAVSVVVFAGDRPGISTGALADVTHATVRIDPAGIVDGLVGLRLAVAPGSSGAPVVDASHRLRGFIVAGSQDQTHAVSFMEPASRWHTRLSRKESSPLRRGAKG